MHASKAEVFARLQTEMLRLQGFTPSVARVVNKALPAVLQQAFPHQCFPTAALHEFVSRGAAQFTATVGFVAGLLSALHGQKGMILWLCRQHTLFAPSLSGFQLAPGRVIFVQCARESELLWAFEEALKCRGLAAVVAELSELDFTASRRLQLAVEQSRVSGFLLRNHPRNHTIASVSRWCVEPAVSPAKDGLPGITHPRWKVQLQKVRNGRPGTWLVDWAQGRLKVAATLMQTKTAQPLSVCQHA